MAILNLSAVLFGTFSVSVFVVVVVFSYIHVSISISLYIHKVVVGSTSNTSMMCVALDNNIDLSMTYFASSGP